MFEYFESNYPWNLATLMVLNTGGQLSEVDDVLRPLKAMAAGADDAANQAFCNAWLAAARKVTRLADEDEAQGNRRGAAAKHCRAAVYYFAAERQASPSDPLRSQVYEAMLASFNRFVGLRGENCERVEVPYGDGKSLPALLVRAKGSVAQAPCVIHFDGLDVCKEYLYLGGMPQELAERGVSTLIVDHPGVGEALRKRGLTSIAQTEVAATACVDWLETRSDVDRDRIGIMALSLGGYYAPRAAAFEPRLKCCVAWGGLYSVGESVRRRLGGASTQKSVHHYFEHVSWVMGVDSMEEVQARADQMTLKGILDRIRCPLLVVHGENDRQVPLEFAQRTYDEAINSSQRELKIHRVADGGSEHCSVDNRELTIDYIAHWIACTLGAGKD